MCDNTAFHNTPGPCVDILNPEQLLSIRGAALFSILRFHAAGRREDDFGNAPPR
jgi:hypothetical protein